jgi:hypothetical protein
MKTIKTFIIVLFVSSSLFGQVVEVDGQLKIAIMDTVNTEDLLVVKQTDGTLATRQLNSLSLPTGDTVRTLQSDLLLTSALCNCANLPPAMIQSLVNNGYSVQDLISFEISVVNLLAGGINPLDLIDAGMPIDSLYGKFYEGGYIFYLDTLNEHSFDGLVVLGTTIAGPIWGCENILVGVPSSAIGAGQSNTIDIVNTCSGNAAVTCNNITNGYNDWFLSSKDELNLMYVNLHLTGLLSFSTANPYWSSTEINSASAWIQDFSDGDQQTINKGTTSLRVRPVRAF